VRGVAAAARIRGVPPPLVRWPAVPMIELVTSQELGLSGYLVPELALDFGALPPHKVRRGVGRSKPGGIPPGAVNERNDYLPERSKDSAA
jgi:hypothetical protein